MVATVRCYYNTGLTPSNCLDDSSKLDSLDILYHDFPNIAVKQDRGRINIRINTVYDNIKDADYCKINNNCYWITSINMLNDNVASLGLQQDYLTTVGINNIRIISGWCTRRHVQNDALFSNVIDEGFVPSKELVCEGFKEIGRNTDKSHINVIVSNIDLTNLDKVAEEYVSSNLDKVLVPQLPALGASGNTVYTSYPNSGIMSGYSAEIAMTTAYNPNTAIIRDALGQIRSLGIESCIGAAYSIPSEYVNKQGGTESSPEYTSLSDANMGTLVRSTIPLTLSGYKNNKVFSGQFMKYVMYSICSGDSSEFRVEDIARDYGDGPFIYYIKFADLRYNGYPGCKPANYKGNNNDSMFGAIKGAGWQQAPFMYTVGTSGWAVSAADASKQFAMNLTSQGTNILGGLGDVALRMLPMAASYNNAAYNSNTFMAGADAYDTSAADNYFTGSRIAGGASGAAGTVAQGVTGIFQSKQSWVQSINQAMRVKPELNFPVLPQLQDFIGNKFFELRYRLDDYDMTRFDNYLTQFGYAVSEELTNDCFKHRLHFNYVVAEEVNLEAANDFNLPLYLKMGVIDQIEKGVRIWHRKPSLAAMTDNPII